MRVLPEGRSGAAENGPLVQVTFEAGDYFKTMGIAVLAGRPLETNDHLSALPNVVISKSAADLLWPGENAIGRRLQRQGLDRWETVVGVVEDVMQDNFRQRPAAARVFPARRAQPDGLAHLVTGVRRPHAARRVHRARHPRDRARDRAGSADVPRVHDGRARPAVDGGRLVHDADARRRVRAGADSWRRRSLRRAVVRRRRADARNRRADGARRARRASQAHGRYARAPAS